MADRKRADVSIITTEASLETFASALVDAVSVRRVTQKHLADELGTTQPAVSAWTRADAEPAPSTVFALERALELPPGHLSRLLGYLPLDAVEGSAATFEAVVSGDPILDETQKRGLLALYREFASRPRRGGRPSNGRR